MAGVAGEVVACGDAEGGFADVMQLRELMRGASPPLASPREQDEKIRWATLFALTLLKQHDYALNALMNELEAARDVGSCILAIEEAKDSADMGESGNG